MIREDNTSGCVLVPLGLSPIGEPKLDVAEAQAKATGRPVVLLHVLPESARGAQGVVTPEEAQARAFLDTWVARFRAAGVRAAPLVRFGSVVRTVQAVARQLGASLLVIGSDARPGLARYLPGGHAGAIASGAPCPVLLVRPDTSRPAAVPPLRRLEDDLARVGQTEEHALGHRTVDVARIVGLAGTPPDREGSAATELGADFRPNRKDLAEEEQFKQLVKLAEWGEQQRPVDLHKLGYGYYVAGGHQQVAAARHVEQLWIDAVVTEHLPRGNVQARAAFSARKAFERRTGLTRVGAARAETYERLGEMIGSYARQTRIADEREAAARWYASVFRPVQVEVRARRLEEHFPGERTADIFVRVTNHVLSARGRTAARLSWDEALSGFERSLEAELAA
jgi:nucleotide-binding universal stress UspA family protein